MKNSKHNKNKKKSNRMSFTKKFTRWIDHIADKVPDRLTGRSDIMFSKYASVYEKNKGMKMVTEAKRRTGRLYLLIFLILILVIISFSVKLFFNSPITMDLSRNPYDGESKVFSAEVESKYGGESQSQSAEIVIQPKGLTEEEKKSRIKTTKNNLGTLILKENNSLDNIKSNLDLLTVDADTGVEIAWSSENEELVDDEGIVNLLVARENETVVLNAQLRLEDLTDNIKLNIAFGKPSPGNELTAAMKSSVHNMIDELSIDDHGEKLILPQRTPEGVNLSWKEKTDNGIIIQISAILLIGLCIFYSRYSNLDKTVKETKDSISRDFPDFINKLVLLLNAGMVVTTAFEKISSDYENRINKNEKKYFYEELCSMSNNIKSINSGFLEELYDIAQRSGVRDVMRFNTIIVDNIGKGSALTDKLQSESQILWTGRIKMAEEKGRLAETKLTFPMVLQLLVLIMITIAPAAMEM